jgi:hypothetical protein
MEYYCYKDAFDAVVEDNEGVLPDLYEVFDFILYCRPAHLEGPVTVAEIVAYALIEASEAKINSAASVPRVPQMPAVPMETGGLLYLDKFIDQAVASLN